MYFILKIPTGYSYNIAPTMPEGGIEVSFEEYEQLTKELKQYVDGKLIDIPEKFGELDG